MPHVQVMAQSDFALQEFNFTSRCSCIAGIQFHVCVFMYRRASRRRLRSSRGELAKSFPCIFVTRRSHTTYSCVWNASIIRVTWLIHKCDVTHSFVRHNLCDITHSYMRHDSFIHTAWLLHMRDMIHSSGWHRTRRRCSRVAAPATATTTNTATVDSRSFHWY